MRILSLILLTFFTLSCSATLDLERFTQGDGGVVGNVTCGFASTFDEGLTNLSLEVSNWPTGTNASVVMFVVGTRLGESGTEFIASAVITNQQEKDRTYVMRKALVPGTHAAFAFSDNNGIPGYQGATECAAATPACVADTAWKLDFCTDGSVKLAPPEEGTKNGPCRTI